jgi:hypothetical protein
MPVEVDVEVLKSEIKRTYASVLEEPEKDFIFPTGRAWARGPRLPRRNQRRFARRPPRPCHAPDAFRLLELGLAHLVASDAHAPDLRAVGMTDALRAIRDVTLAR